MPTRTRQNDTGAESSTTTTTTTGEDVERDSQDLLGNGAMLDPAIRELLGEGGMGAEQDGLTGVLAMAAEEQTPERVRDRAEDVADKVTLAAGTEYAVTAEDLAAYDAWKKIARDHGMSPEHLVAFNQHVQSVNVGTPAEAQSTTTTELAEGVSIYIPSAAEIMLAQCREQTDSYEAAVSLYGELSQGPNVKLMTVARDRASGKVGESYGTKGVEGGKFLTQNPTLAGASAKRSEVINGQREYKVFWLKDFWKCSLYMHDVVWSAGYKPHQSDNDHYLVAGRLQESPQYDEIDVKDARPGDCWQRFGGTRSNESHNAILSSFVKVEDVDEGHDRWTFSIVGAETERAAESERTHMIKKGTNENTGGKRIRFFRPKSAR